MRAVDAIESNFQQMKINIDIIDKIKNEFNKVNDDDNYHRYFVFGVDSGVSSTTFRITSTINKEEKEVFKIFLSKLKESRKSKLLDMNSKKTALIDSVKSFFTLQDPLQKMILAIESEFNQMETDIKIVEKIEEFLNYEESTGDFIFQIASSLSLSHGECFKESNVFEEENKFFITLLNELQGIRKQEYDSLFEKREQLLETAKQLDSFK